LKKLWRPQKFIVLRGARRRSRPGRCASFPLSTSHHL
jgi:hypothetical protein